MTLGDRRRGFNLLNGSLPRYTNFKVQDWDGTSASSVAPVGNLRDCSYRRMLRGQLRYLGIHFE